MEKKYKKILIISITVNILFVSTAVFLFYKGSFKKILKPFIRSYYQNKSGHFKTLSQTGIEIVFLGDSLTDRCEWSELFNRANIVNRGIEGDTTAGVLHRLRDVTSIKPKKIFIMIGANDYGFHQNVSITVKNYRKIIGRIRSESPATKIYIQSLLPTVQSRIPIDRNFLTGVNSEIKKIADNGSIYYIDIYSRLVDEKGDLSKKYTIDGAHLNGKGYLVWKKAISDHVN